MNSLKLLSICLIATLAQFATDIYLPSLPSIADYFGVSIDGSQFTIAVYMIALTVTQLFWGPFSDVVGRKKALYLGLFISSVGTVLCYQATSLEILIAGRLIQGLGNGAAAGLFRAILRDMYSGEELARIGSYLSNFIVLTLMLAPAIGGVLESYYSWQGSFLFLLFWAFLNFLLLRFSFEETKKSRSSVAKVTWFQAYKRLLKSPVFMGCCLSNFLTYGGMFAWITMSSTLLVKQLEMDPMAFGFWSGVTGAGLMIGAFINGSLVKKFGIRAMLSLGWGLIISSGALLFMVSLSFGSSVPVILFSAFGFYLGSAFIFANTNGVAFTPFGDIAGTASGLYAFIQYSGGAVMSYLVASISHESPLLLGGFFLFSGVSACFVFFSFNKSS